MTRIVHTADWHLGARLVDGDRAEEHRRFLDWLLSQLAALQPDLLIVAGDVFDSANPPQDALTLYYGFLARVAATTACRVLILGGNHDSPATLHAPRELLAALRIDVIGSAPPDDAGVLLEFEDVIVCGIPYLRERDVRVSAPGQSIDQVAAAIREGIGRHYRRVHDAAKARCSRRLLVGTGHLTAVGVNASASERKIHIGNLGAVEASCFGGFAYTALGHIHRAQAVGGNQNVRYSGSPIALSFAEADTPKEIQMVDLDGTRVSRRTISIPLVRPLLRIGSELASLGDEILRKRSGFATDLEPWVELTLMDARAHADVDRLVRDIATTAGVRILKLVSPPAAVEAPEIVKEDPFAGQTLRDLQPAQVFEERLRRLQIDPVSEQGQILLGTFSDLLGTLHEEPTGEARSGA